MKLDDFDKKKPKKIITIFSGGFHIFSPGHKACWDFLVKEFPTADHFIASSNVITDRPFTFPQKRFLAAQAGIPPKQFIQVKSPYRALEITEHYKPENTILIFGISSKDKERFGSSRKKDGSLGFMQPYPGNLEKCETFDKRAYYVVVPAIKFSIQGIQINSASQVRSMYYDANGFGRYEIIKDLYPKSNRVAKIKEILDSVLLGRKMVKEDPDFSYTHFKNRDEEISKLEWLVDSYKTEEGNILRIRAHKKNADLSSKDKLGDYEGLITALIKNGNFWIRNIKLREQGEWHSTGLGQMLYDKLFAIAKERRIHYVYSDQQRRPSARRAWEKIAKRYRVEHVGDRDRVDLKSKVNEEKLACLRCSGTGKIKGKKCLHCKGKKFIEVSDYKKAAANDKD